MRTIRYLSRTLSVCGALLVLVALGVGIELGARPARAQDLPPRPTAVPTAAPPPASQPDQPRPDVAAAPTGRITGTVIDQTTGAPAPGISVAVGERVVMTDANGNYDSTGLASGSYRVALALAQGQGNPAQEPITVTLAPDATVVQHLFFRSQPTAVPTPVATVTAPAGLPRTSAPDHGGGLWVVLGVGMIALGGGLRIAQQRQA